MHLPVINESISPTSSLRHHRCLQLEPLSFSPTRPSEPHAAGPRCVARNVSCVRFPTRAQCQGIAAGGCISKQGAVAATRSQFSIVALLAVPDRVSGLVMILNPRIVFATVMVVIAVVVGVGAVAYYLIRKSVGFEQCPKAVSPFSCFFDAFLYYR